MLLIFRLFLPFIGSTISRAAARLLAELAVQVGWNEWRRRKAPCKKA